MATAATSLLGLALPVTGELSGTWGDTVNVSITALLDTAVAGTTTLSSDADVTLTTTTLAANQARQAIILWTAGGTVTRTITVPAQSKSYIVINKTSSSQSIKIVGAGPTTGVTIVAGTAAFVVWNGVDFVTASVTSTTGILPVANGGTGLASGTSGGVLAYTATGTLASSAALAASALVIGGGAGAAPSTTTTGTGVVTALGVNTGTAGAFVVNGGALGSPSTAGTMPAFTLGGTVSGGGNQINNVVIGTSTPLAGAFTTLSATGDITSTGAIKANLNGANAFAILQADSSGAAGGKIWTLASNATGSTIGTAGGLSVRSSTDSITVANFTSTGLAVTGTLSATQLITATAGVVVGTGAGTYTAGSLGFSNANEGFLYRPPVAGLNTAHNFQSFGGTKLVGITESGTLSGGTSGTAYSFSGSAPATSLTLDSSGNLGLGVTPSAWNTGGKAIEVKNGGNGLYCTGTNTLYQLSNAFLNSVGDFKYSSTNFATQYTQYNGAHEWHTAPSGTAGDTITFTKAMTLFSDGNLTIGDTSSGSRLNVVTTAPSIATMKSTAVNGGYLTFSNGSTVPLYIGFGSTLTTGLTTSDAALRYSNNLVFSSAATEKMRIDSSGNLLVGTISIYNSAKFSVAGDSEQRGNIRSYLATRAGLAIGGTQTLWSFANGNYGSEMSMTLYVAQRDDINGFLSNDTFNITAFGGGQVTITSMGAATYSGGRAFTVTATSASGGIIVTMTNTSGVATTSVNMAAHVLYGYPAITWGF